MVNEALIWDKFYKELIPDEIWNYKLQYDLALEAVKYYTLFNHLTIIDIDTLQPPYLFTTKDLYEELIDILGFHQRDFVITPNNDAGLTADYIGADDSLIMTINMLKDYTLTVNYMHKGVTSNTSYFYTVDKIWKKKEVERLFTRLFYEWF